MKIYIILLISLLTFLNSCKSIDNKKSEQIYNENINIVNLQSNLKKDWYKDVVFYECLIRSYKDSDGDGNGDIKGLIEKLDYLQSLGIGGLWLMPVTECYYNAEGYDVIDYRSIEKDYGTIEDFISLLQEAHKRNIGVIIDFVPNHSSINHPFFVNSKSSKNSEYRNWYCWSDKDPQWKHPWDNNGKVWHKTDSGYYYAVFYPELPDFNYRNPSVVSYMKDNLKFWLNLEVDGFRFDAVHILIENDSLHQINQRETHLVYQDFRENIFNKYDNIFVVSEAPFTGGAFLGNGKNEFHSTFSFEYSKTVMQGLKNENARSIIKAIEQAKFAPSGSNYSILLSNHDSFAGHRPFTQLNRDDKRCKLAASILLTSPGIPFIYYGEEIGMDTIDISLVPYPDFQLRTPMQWSESENSGFTDGKPYKNINLNYREYNVETEEKNPDSIINHYKKLIKIRNENKSLSLGDFESVITSDKNKTFAFIRKFEDEIILIVSNVTKENNIEIILDFSNTNLSSQTIKFEKDLMDENIKFENIDEKNSNNYKIMLQSYSLKLLKFKVN